MKTVFDNDMVAHVWAQHSQDTGRSSNGNFWFEGDTIYSYRTPICRRVTNKKGETAYIRATRRYSATTSSKHQPAISRAIRGTIFHVDALTNREWIKETDNDHKGNLARYAEQYEEILIKSSRAKTNGEWLLGDAAQLRVEAERYAEFFGLKKPKLKAPTDEVIKAAREKAAIESKKKAEQTKKHKAEAERLELEKKEKWLNGESVYFRGRCDLGGAMLRIVADEVETSQGAKIPVDHAKKAFKKIAAVKAAGIAWEKNGETVRVGHFQIDGIYPHYEGGELAIKAGCHVIYWPEIQRIAQQLDIKGA